MAKTFSAVYPSLSILIIMLLLFVVGGGISSNSNNNHTDNKAFAITNTSSSLSSLPKTKEDTFSAIGTINSLVITVPESGFNITNAFKVILTGEWNLSVRKGNVTNFAANFLASPMDGTKPHIHQITNFKKADNNNNNNNSNIGRGQQKIVRLTLRDNSLSVNGTVDVKINGVTIWKNAHVSIMISKGNTIAIRLNDKDTSNHFGKQPVLGIVTRLIL